MCQTLTDETWKIYKKKNISNIKDLFKKMYQHQDTFLQSISTATTVGYFKFSINLNELISGSVFIAIFLNCLIDTCSFELSINQIILKNVS